MQLPETEYRPDEKYEHPEPGNIGRVPTENIPPTPAPAVQEQPIKETKKETIQVPTSLVRWFCYTVLFQIVLVPVAMFTPLNPWCTLSIALILGHFSGQLNKLIDK